MDERESCGWCGEELHLCGCEARLAPACEGCSLCEDRPDLEEN